MYYLGGSTRQEVRINRESTPVNWILGTARFGVPNNYVMHPKNRFNYKQ